MKALLDTHTILHIASAPERLGPQAGAIIRDRHNQLFASLASLWEIVIKVRIGKLDLPSHPAEFWKDTLSRARLFEMPIERTAIIGTLAMSVDHRDPFDRLLASQAIEAGIPFLSADPEVDILGVVRIW